MHAELCMHAERWLRKSGCGVTAIDLATVAGEQPDAIGWRYGLTALCEVKVSRGDFLADRKKPWRARPELGMGDWRFYVAPSGILRAEDMPEGWGLLEFDGKRLQRSHNVPHGNMWGAPPFAGHKRHEALMECSLIRRLQRPESDRRKATKAACAAREGK
jgi:hypothetical protein